MDARKLLDRMIGAALLRSSTYEEVEHDARLTGEALWVVVIASLVSGLGLLVHHVRQAGTDDLGRAGLGLAFGIGGTVAAYLVWAGITYYVGASLLGGTADMGQMRRTLGYSASPRLIGVFVFVPTIGASLHSISWLWWLAASVVAIRQALDFSTGRAIGTVLVGWLLVFLAFVLLGTLVGAFTLAAVVPFV